MVEYSIVIVNLVLWKKKCCVERNQIYFVEENLLVKKLEVLFLWSFVEI